MPTNGFHWLRPEELLKIAATRELTTDEQLALKSRSFYGPTLLCEKAKGRDEANKRGIITVFYNDERFLDCAEDGLLAVPQKILCIEEYLYIMKKAAQLGPSEDIDKLIDERLKPLSERLKTGAVDEKEKVFIEQFGKGQNLREYHVFKQSVKEAIKDCTLSMGTGMRHFLEKERLDTMEELKEYCQDVASSVGVALNRIVETEDVALNVRLSDGLARGMGSFLQRINIMKNLEEDYRVRKFSYIPLELRPGITNEDLFNLDQRRYRDLRRKVIDIFDTLVGETERDRRVATDYIASIPSALSGYTAFCLAAYLSGVETLALMRNAGAEEVFKGNKETTKIKDETFMNVMNFSAGIVNVEKGRDIRSWLAQYKERPQKYSFEIGKYEKWSPEWLK